MSSKLVIPDALKTDVPENKWGKVLAATPVIMTVIATLLAGLSSGEMTRAQYDRSLAAQLQSKAGDQWNYFQAKRLRAALQRNTLDILHSAGGIHRLNPDTLKTYAAFLHPSAKLQSVTQETALLTLATGQLPDADPAGPMPPRILEARDAIDSAQADSEVAKLLSSISPADLESSLQSAKKNVRELDAVLRPVEATIREIEVAIAVKPPGGNDPFTRDFIAARLDFAAQRYDLESRQNQVIAQLYELQVRQSNISAERHHRRSERFFYGMLVAQMGVIISTFSLAARQRSILWALGAAAGVSAIAFAAYVYLFV